MLKIIKKIFGIGKNLDKKGVNDKKSRFTIFFHRTPGFNDYFSVNVDHDDFHFEKRFKSIEAAEEFFEDITLKELKCYNIGCERAKKVEELEEKVEKLL